MDSKHTEDTKDEAIKNCPTPAYHQTHTYCPSCPFVYVPAQQAAAEKVMEKRSDMLGALAEQPTEATLSEAEAHAKIIEGFDHTAVPKNPAFGRSANDVLKDLRDFIREHGCEEGCNETGCGISFVELYRFVKKQEAKNG